MKTELYNEIVSTILSFKSMNIHGAEILETKFSRVKNGTLRSIYASEVQKWTKYRFWKAQNSAQEIYAKYIKDSAGKEPPGIIIRIADEYKIPYSLIAKLILKQHYTEKNSDCNTNETVTALTMKKQLHDTTLIEDKDLSYEVFLCSIYDNQYSSISELIRMSLGQQYEIKLYKKMDKLGIIYRNEEYLRKFGFDKTPDVKLEMPIAVDGFIVHWIESKARFGDLEAHKDYLKNQYTSYWNRFGTGLIIYWFGYLDELEDPNEKRFIMRDHLPSHIIKLNSTTLRN